jgi:hypothetical protein
MPAEHDQSQRTVVIKHDGLRSVGPFAAFPTKILRNASVTVGARLTYGLLLSYAWQEDFCFPAQEQLAKDLGMTDRNVRRFLVELKEKGLIDWKQLGLNKPNRYYILEIDTVRPGSPEGTPQKSKKSTDRTPLSGPDRTDMSGQDWTGTSAQERTPVSDYKQATTNTQLVNDVTANEHEELRRKPGRPGRGTPSRISDRALRSTYALTDEQIARVHWLVEKQAKTLGHVETNHGFYVKRAAEAVRDGLADQLDFKLGDFAQAAKEIAVTNRPAYFHTMWTEEAAGSTAPAATPAKPTVRVHANAPERLSELLGQRAEAAPAVHPTIARMIADAEQKGHPVPAYIRSADLSTVTRWWASVVETTAEIHTT